MLQSIDAVDKCSAFLATAVFRNYVDSKAMYCDDGTLNGQCKLFLLKYVRNLLIDEAAHIEQMHSQ